MIPRILHHIWVGPPMPTHIADYVASWDEYHPDWEHWVWRDGDLRWISHLDIYDDAVHLVPRDAVQQLQSDIARYAILERWGGLYVDADTECLRPVDDAIEGHDTFAAWEDNRWVGNTYVGCVPYHPVTRSIQEQLPASIYANRRRRPNKMTGPQFLTPIWKRHGCHVAPQKQWFPYSYTHVKRGRVPTEYGDAYAVHHWEHTRRVLRR